MVKKTGQILILVSILLNFSVTAFSQVTIVPTNLFVNSHSHFGTMQIKNSSPQTQEITIKFKFGYPVTDSLGNVRMNYHDSLAASKYSMAPWIHAFPRSFTLQPNTSQLVRLLIRAPEHLKTGMYWTRVQTISTPKTSPIGQHSGNHVSAQISFRFNQVTSAYLKVGNPSTGIEIESFRYKEAKNQLITYIKAKRLKNAPFLGTIYVRLYQNGNKQPIKSTQVMTSIFFNQTSRIIFDNVDKLKAGTYTADVTFKSQRNDIDPNDLIHMTTVSKKFNVRLQ